MPTLYFARVPFTYNKKNLDRGEIAELKDTPRDAKLVGLGYFRPYDKHEHRDVPCDMCGRHFVNEQFYRDHKMKPGGCNGQPSPITKHETAELLDMDPTKVKVEE